MGQTLGRCQICHEQSPLISSKLGVCLQCIREKSEKALGITDKVHTESRKRFDLPSKPPNASDGMSCDMCANDCRIPEGGKGFCGLVFNLGGRLVRRGGTAGAGILEWYYDPLPTNCVAWWFCPGCTGAGYPKYAYKPTSETGYSNLAIFYGACSLDCLCCQNWHYRNLTAKLRPTISAESLAAKAGPQTSCICYFGGDPSVQMPHALKTSQLAFQKAKEEERILRICWETNGYWKSEFAIKAAELSLKSGGVMKFDLKTWNPDLSRALSGVSNAPTLESFMMIGESFFEQRGELPVLTASTLLVPGYIDVEEVDGLARLIAEISPGIPYTLLAFYPNYMLTDLPTTSRDIAYQCLEAADKHLENVRIGNIHLLS
ncbi:MAG: radical SAM protein [Candidatus Bathyarchaeota archaeon]|nr:MAG: radical SAM protein [Candidatus Bathyarchaeota archaeon]